MNSIILKSLLIEYDKKRKHAQEIAEIEKEEKKEESLNKTEPITENVIENIEKPKINIDVDSIVSNDKVTDDEFFDDFFGDDEF